MIQEKLDRIRNFFVKREYTSDVLTKYPGVKFFDDAELLEEERVSKDLDDIHTRLQNGEYLLKDFSSKNTFDIAWRQREFFVYLHSYYDIAQSRSYLISLLDLKTWAKIADICPWRSPKIPLGLYYSWFQWELYLIDKDLKAQKMINEFMKLFNDWSHIHNIEANIWDENLGTYDLVAWNHIFDDLLLSYYQEKINNKFELKKFYSDESYMKETRNNIIHFDDKIVDELVSYYVKVIKNIIHPWWYLIVTHYKSYVDDIFGHDHVLAFCILIQKKIAAWLLQNWLSDRSNLIQEKKLSYFQKDHCILLQKN